MKPGPHFYKNVILGNFNAKNIELPLGHANNTFHTVAARMSFKVQGYLFPLKYYYNTVL